MKMGFWGVVATLVIVGGSVAVLSRFKGSRRFLGLSPDTKTFGEQFSAASNS